MAAISSIVLVYWIARKGQLLFIMYCTCCVSIGFPVRSSASGHRHSSLKSVEMRFPYEYKKNRIKELILRKNGAKAKCSSSEREGKRAKYRESE